MDQGELDLKRQLDVVVAGGIEHRTRADLLRIASGLLGLVHSKLEGLTPRDSNPLDTGSVTFSTHEIMRAVGVYNLRGVARQISLGQTAVIDARGFELEKASEAEASANALRDELSDDAAAEALVSRVKDGGLAGG